MRFIYTIRDRFAVPAIAALLAGAVVAIPAQALIVPARLSAGQGGRMIHEFLAVVIAIWIGAPLQIGWERWRRRRQPLILLVGGRAPRRGPEGGADRPHRQDTA